MDANRRFINELLPGQTLDQVFLVRDKQLRTAKSGDYYIACTLCDRTGSVPARMWQASQTIYDAIGTDGFVQIKGRAEEYRNALQLVIEACRPVPADQVDLADFLATTERDVEEMWSELLEILRSIRDKPLRRLIKKFVEDRDLAAAIKRAPAAMQMHHAFIGGLLEHTLNIARAAKALLPLYPKINADLVLAGVFLHDIGKTAELNAGTSIQYTDRGQLVGHLVLAVTLLAEKAAAVSEDGEEPFPPRTLDLLQHIILSHHGAHEYGSPKLPAIPEAFFIHYLDNLDAKMWMTANAVESDTDPNASFTPYLKQIETRLYKRSQKLDE